MRTRMVKIGFFVLASSTLSAGGYFLWPVESRSATQWGPVTGTSVRSPEVASPKGRLLQPTARGVMASLSATPAPTGLHVQARAELTDSRQGVSYVWMALVHPSERYEFGEYGEPTLVRVYDTQAFQPDPRGPMTPTFDDVLEAPLAPGRYVVEVGLCSLPQGQAIGAPQALWDRNFVAGSTEAVVE